ncbi:3-hydroxyacyl-CoA dehydrogenase [Archaeoglobus fulgidus]|uniref:L-gulonate 3-dehydrogenase n=2 Tax=Archaeoglobus fulgidus TaxID=2234 RepID=O29062_ARCFU|nr:3-hydroxyacyl-CoA dehydrogenase family protein [Archaeoglobus fulgidus]AAB90039.1 3-hydroxyacyl-CoA dehydrogenase (hbd-8) [Archaeoglobus fulgidus DSM 4304]AIG98080.1 3-hydroxyacyl-CoA dehydrogenase [Archaeoglobus fulgidus DSM 8774]
MGVKVACIGAGTVGASWASLFAWRGCDVAVYDPFPEALNRAEASIARTVSTLSEIFSGSEDDVKSALSRVKFTENLEEALKGAYYVQESAVEKLEVKRDLFEKMDAIAEPETILATSTSGLSISEIQTAARKHPERCITAHPYNPPHLIPLVEVVPRKQTDESCTEKTVEFMERMGKKPIVVKKDVPGMVANRLAAALWREAVNLVYQGIATPEEIDVAVKYGPGIRWAITGVYLTYHLGGGQGGMKYFLEFFDDHYRRLWSDLANWSEYPEGSFDAILKSMEGYDIIKRMSYDELAKWRDDQLAKILKLILEDG